MKLLCERQRSLAGYAVLDARRWLRSRMQTRAMIGQFLCGLVECLLRQLEEARADWSESYHGVGPVPEHHSNCAQLAINPDSTAGEPGMKELGA